MPDQPHTFFTDPAIGLTVTAPPTLPLDYIDPEHQGEDLELLETFYRACAAEGGTADEIHLRGLRAVLAARPAALPAPEVGEVGELIAWLHDHALSCRELGRNDWAAQVTSAADLLQQPAAPASAVVWPVRFFERLPDPRPESEGGDCDAEGRCWFLQPRSATPFPCWTLLWRGHMQPCYSHWLPASAIPLPQAGEVEA